MRTARRAVGGVLVALLLVIAVASVAGAEPSEPSGAIELGPEGVAPAIEESTPVPGLEGNLSAEPAPIPRAAEDEPEATVAADQAVAIADFLFDPETIEVSVGDTVTWTNDDEAPHDATADDDSFATKLLDEGESDSVTFDEEGTFSYICSIHPPDAGYDDFVGTVEVVAASSGDGGSGGGGGGETDGGAAIPPIAELDTGVDSLDSGTASAGSSSGSLPETGLDAVVLLAIGAGLLAAGLLARAVVEHLSWR